MLTNQTQIQADSITKTNPELQKMKYSASGWQLQMRVDMKPFTDIRVRKALQMAVNLPDIAQNYYKGTVNPYPVGLVSPEYAGYAIKFNDWPQSVKDEYTYNPEGAKKLLAEAGYPNGFDTDIVSSSSNDLDLLQVFKAYFADIGVNMEIRPMETNALQAFVNAGKHDQMVYMTSTAGLPPYVSLNNWEGRGRTWTHHGDTAFDAIIDEFLASPDEDAAQKKLAEADMYFITHHWTVEAVPTSSYSFWSPNLKGYSGESSGMSLGGYYYARFWKE